LANKNLNQATAPEAIEEVREVRKMDEKALVEIILKGFTDSIERGDFKLGEPSTAKSDFEKTIDEYIEKKNPETDE
jgi:phage tail tube protein FII